MILLIGSTGFTGQFVLKELYNNGYSVRCFVRQTSIITRLKDFSTELAFGELCDENSLKKALEGIDTVVCVASLGFGHAPIIIRACEEMKVKRVVFFSTTGIFTKLNPQSKAIRLEAESLIRESSLQYTIVRPTMIYGTHEDRNIYRLVRFLQKFPVIPVLGNGNYLQQPVYVNDLAKAVVAILQEPKCIRQEYNLSGEEELTYNALVDIISLCLGKKIIKVHIPLKVCTVLLGLYEKLVKKPKIKKEQALRLNENKNFSYKKAQEDFGYSPLSLREGIKLEIAEIENK